MTKKQTSPKLYFVFWAIIIALILLIGWFVYLLIKPAGESKEETTTKTTTNSTTQTNDSNDSKQKKKKTTNNNTNATETNTNTTNTNVATNESSTVADEEGGLVEPPTEDDADAATGDEPDAEDDTTDGDSTESDAAETDSDTDTKKVTLYFPKSSSDCGDVFPVERDLEPTDDFYGQIILEDMAGPTAEESDYTSAIPAGLRLRRVEYTSAGPRLLVNEVYSELDDCAQATVDAQLIETANAMFELPKGTAGEVIAGAVEEDTNEETSDAEDETTSAEE